MFGIFKDDINHLEYNAYQLTRTHQELTSINQELTSRVERLFNFNECHFNLI